MCFCVNFKLLSKRKMDGMQYMQNSVLMLILFTFIDTKQIRFFGVIFQNFDELQKIRQRIKAVGCKSIKFIYVSAVLTYAVRVAFHQNLKGSQCACRSSSMPRQPAHRNRDPLLLHQSRHQTSASTNRQWGDRKLECGNNQWGTSQQPAQQCFSQCAP